MPAVSAARQLAFDLLRKVEGGGYASDLLHQETHALDSRDAGLASELVFGVLRHRPQLDHLIQRYAGRPQPKLDIAVRTALHLGIYQLRYLDRIPPHAAVMESVELVKRSGKRNAVGFTNAVLRKVNRNPVFWPDRATELCLPPWLLDRWTKTYGAETAASIARAFLAPPERYLRVPPGVEPPPGAEPTEVPGCYRAAHPIAGFRQQDIGSQSVPPLLGVGPGHRVLDLCAAPGNKTAQLRESGATVIACDLHWHRIRSVPGPAVALNGESPLPFRQKFDRILLDAPCSGTGTLGRNPEIKWRLRPEDLADLQRRQIRLLTHALEALAPDGRLLYATCSLEPEENAGVVAAVPGIRVLEHRQRTPGRDPGDGFEVHLLAAG